MGKCDSATDFKVHCAKKVEESVDLESKKLRDSGI